MSDFDNTIKKITDVLYTAARKSSEILENTKISYSISGEKEKISKIQARIGVKLYQLYKVSETAPSSISIDEFLQDFEEIAGIEKVIAEMEKNAAENKSSKICPECSARLELESVYCPKCGAKLPVEPKPAPAPEREEGPPQGD